MEKQTKFPSHAGSRCSSQGCSLQSQLYSLHNPENQACQQRAVLSGDEVTNDKIKAAVGL